MAYLKGMGDDRYSDAFENEIIFCINLMEIDTIESRELELLSMAGINSGFDMGFRSKSYIYKRAAAKLMNLFDKSVKIRCVTLDEVPYDTDGLRNIASTGFFVFLAVPDQHTVNRIKLTTPEIYQHIIFPK